MVDPINFAFHKAKRASKKETYDAAARKQHRAKTKEIQISHPDDVARLPWKGNYADDEHLHHAVSKYVRKEKDPHKAYRAEYHANKLGMGQEVPETPSKDALDWIKSIHGEEI